MLARLNWVDWTIVAVCIYYMVQGWGVGFVDLGLSFISFFISFWFSIKFHAPVGAFLLQKFGIPAAWAAVLGYIIVAIIVQTILSELAHVFMNRLPKKVVSSKLNKWFGMLVSICNGLIIIVFFLLVILALPLRGTIKTDLQQSQIGNFLIRLVQTYGGSINTTIKQAGREVMKFITIEPDSNESISLPVSPSEREITEDAADEMKMVDLVNEERAKNGVGKLYVDNALTDVARVHSRDMFLRRYFSHINPEGETAGDRMEKSGIHFTVAGENIAYAPDLASAHTGLMDSPGHRKNILDTSFHRIGIGIMTTDSWGMMFTQDFAD